MLWSTFVPCFLWIFFGAPYIEALRHWRALNAAMACITAAVVGVILNLSAWFADVQVTDWGWLHLSIPTLATFNFAALILTTVAVIAMFRFKVGMPLTLTVCAVLGLLSPLTHADETTPLVVEAKIPLGNVGGRIDHLAIDLARQCLYVAELGNNSVGVIDLKEPQGIGYVAATDTVFVADAGDGSVRLYSGETLAPAGQIALGDDADNVRVDPVGKRVYVGYGSGALAVIDPMTKTKLEDIQLKGHPESFQLEREGQRIFVNVPDANEMAVIDRELRKQSQSWPQKELHANYPMTFDETNQRLLVVFRRPAILAAFNVKDGSLVSRTESCGDADDVFLDRQRQRVYVICGAGLIDTFEQRNGAYVKLASASTISSARAGLYVPELDRLFLATRSTLTSPAAIWILRPAS